MTTRGILRIWQGRPLTAIALLALIVAWIGQFTYTTQQSRHTAFLAARVRPFLVNGYRIRLDDRTTLLESSVANGSAARARLLFVVSDDCAFSEQELPNWVALIDRVPWTPDVEALVVSTSGRRIADRLLRPLRARGARYRLLAVNAPRVTAAPAGLIGTPYTMLLDNESTVRLIVPRLDASKERSSSRCSSAPSDGSRCNI